MEGERVDSAPSALRRVGTGPDVDELLHAERAVVYKHSPICGASALAMEQVLRFAAANPDVPVYQVDVIRERALSDRLARQLGVGHASPQVIVLRKGHPCWDGSHFEVTADQIARQNREC